MRLDLRGPIAGNAVYSNNELVAEDVTVNLPTVEVVTSEYKAMGALELPNIGQFNSMELSITKIGVDKGLAKMTMLEMQNLEIRFVQQGVTKDGASKMQGCKAFIKGVPKQFPGIGVEVGSASESEITYSVSRYQLFVDGAEVILIDKLNGIARINGVDYYKGIKSLL